ncbi:MAG: FlgD immunoglobulin-like domain containing protein, partial [Spirochaetota bacterium]
SAGLFGAGDASGAGVIAGLGANLATERGVWGSGLHLTALSDELPYEDAGWYSRLRLSFAKAVYSKLFTGAAVNMEAGRGSDPDWGVSADLGMYQQLGDWAFLQEMWWGATLENVGKNFRWTGVDEEVYRPEIFTPSLGWGTRLWEQEQTDLDLAVAARFPRFTNVRLSADVDLRTALGVDASLGYTYDLKQSRNEAVGSFPFRFSLSYRFTPGYDRDGTAAARQTSRPYAGLSEEQAHGEIYSSTAHRQLFILGLSGSLPIDRLDRRPIELEVQSEGDEHITPNPNHLEVPLNISSPYRIAEYWLVIEDQSGEEIRRIGARTQTRVPEFESEELSFFERLFARRAGQEVPEKLVWDGRFEDGTPVPDDSYVYYLEVTDELGRVVRSEPRRVVVDTTPPAIDLSAPYTAFSPDGEGERDVLPIRQSGTREKEWVGTFLNEEGREVGTVQWEDSAPRDFEWDGRDEEGNLLPDGRYEYRIVGTDRAGNTTEKRLEGLVLNTEQYRASLEAERRHFSPGTDVGTDEVVFTLDVEAPRNVLNWDFAVRDREQQLVAERKGTDQPPGTFSFDGRDADGEVLPEGEYRAEIAIHYDHGKSSYTESESVVLDVTPPEASAEPEYRLFSPDEDGRRDTVTIFNETSGEPEWRIRIEDEAGQTVVEESYSDHVPVSYEWDATDDQGNPVSDGEYAYVLEGVDRAGNVGRSNVVTLTVDTTPTPVQVTTDYEYFSPTDSGTQDTLRIEPSLEVTEGISRYVLRVFDAEEEEVVLRREEEQTVPTTFVWDGRDDDDRRVDDGVYVAELEVFYEKGNRVLERTGRVQIDTDPPEATLGIDARHFAPGQEDGRSAVTITQSTSEEVMWQGTLYDEQGEAVRSFEWEGRAPDLQWEGRDADGEIVPDGTYDYELYGRDRAGNENTARLRGIVVDTRDVAADATREFGRFAPTGDGYRDLMVFAISAEPRESVTEWSFGLTDEEGRTVRSFEGRGEPSDELTWDGTVDGELAPEGSYSGELVLRYRNGKTARATTEEFLLDVSAPELSIDLTPLPFGPDGDGVRDELTIRLASEDASSVEEWEVAVIDPTGETFAEWSGEGGPPATIVWDGRAEDGELVQSAVDYEVTFAAADSLRNSAETQSTLPTDILVIRDGDTLKIRIASIPFAPNTADYVNVPEDRRQSNLTTLDRLAEKLQRYPDYQITVEGHANMVFWADEERGRREHEEELVPLSQDRAEAIRDALIERGLSPDRLDTRGVGGDEPIVPFSDTVDRWKNRRVEFVLNRRQ